MLFAFVYLSNWYKTQEIYDRVAYEDPFMVIYYLSRYKTWKMCDKVVDNCLLALKCNPVWIVTSKMLEKSYSDWLNNKKLIFYNDYFNKVIC